MSPSRDIVMCEGCTNGQHFLCGMQTWCECECDGSTDWNEIDPYEGLEIVGGDDDDYY
jgi:hypothetical protein